MRLSLGWEEFALHGSRRGGNPDGWGVAYFAHRDVLLLREPGPAAESPMVTFLAHHAPTSRQIISHSGFDASCIGIACDGDKGLQAVVATVPLDDQPWTPLARGEIACFEQGRRIR